MKPRYENYWQGSGKNFMTCTPGFRDVMDRDRFLAMGNSIVTDITFQRFLETLGAHFIYLQVLNLKSFTAITKQSSWIVHPMRLRSIF